MLSTEQAAHVLGISQVRVRELLKNGRLHGERVGRAWLVDEKSVAVRLASRPRAGRPKEGVDTTMACEDPRIEELRELYARCEKLLANNYDVALYQKLGSGKEARFCAKITDFFLQEKQRELIEAGVF